MFKFLKKNKEKKMEQAQQPEEVKAEKEEEAKTEEIVVEAALPEATDENEKREKKAVYRVIYDSQNREWMVKKDGAQRVIRRVRTKAEALELANQFATNQELSISVQKKDGKFQKKRNYKAMMSTEKVEKQ